MTHDSNFDWIESELAAKGIAIHPPGVYFGMDEEEYHADQSIGSTPLKTLLDRPEDYWWRSQLNPLRPAPKEDTDALIVGRAMHAYVLEGEDAFRDRYMQGPDNSDTSLSSGDKGNRTKAAKKIAAEKGLELIDFESYIRIRLIGTKIQEDEELAKIFRDGYSEVSIFWRNQGVPCKCRLDYLKVKGIGDLKSITNTMGKNYERAVIDQFATLRYDMQAAHYLDGRNTWLPRFVASGQVFGDHDASWLKRVAAFDKSEFMWVFASKTEAPSLDSFHIGFNDAGEPDDMLLYARMKVEEALGNYRRCMDTYGTERAWMAPVKPRKLTMSDTPSWFGMKTQAYNR